MNEILRYLGYKGQEIDEELKLQIQKLIDLFENSITPKFTWGVFDILAEDNIKLVSENIVFKGRDIYNHLKNAKKCAILATTLGTQSERTLMHLSKTRVSDAVIFDAVCTAKIEEFTDECEAEIKAYAVDNGYYTNFRYSPGYGDFSIEVQKDILRVLNSEKRIGLTLTDASLLIPQKSVTAVIGFFESEQNKHLKKCEECNLYSSCIYKNKGRCKGEK